MPAIPIEITVDVPEGVAIDEYERIDTGHAFHVSWPLPDAVVCETCKREKPLNVIDKNKFLVIRDLDIWGQPSFFTYQDRMHRCLHCGHRQALLAPFKRRDVKYTYRFEELVVSSLVKSTAEDVAKQLGISAETVERIVKLRIDDAKAKKVDPQRVIKNIGLDEISRFLLEYLTKERNLARNTQHSYRDTLRLLLPFAARSCRKGVDRLTVLNLSANLIRRFLAELEENRGCSAATRNQRLAALHSLANFIGLHSPEHVQWCGELRTIPFKKTPPGVDQLSGEAGDGRNVGSARPQNSARTKGLCGVALPLQQRGARADEVAQARIADLHLPLVPSRDLAWVLIRGKGNKERRCPLWERTIAELVPLIQGRSSDEHVFLNRCGDPLTRFGVHALVERYAERAAAHVPSLGDKRVSPHTIRHTTATHLLRSGVDINTIRAWMGHVSLATTNVYAEVDLEMKAKALAGCDVGTPSPGKPWREDADLMKFLSNL